MVYLGGAVLAGIMKVHILYPLPPTHTRTTCKIWLQNLVPFSNSLLAIGGRYVSEFFIKLMPSYKIQWNCIIHNSKKFRSWNRIAGCSRVLDKQRRLFGRGNCLFKQMWSGMRFTPHHISQTLFRFLISNESHRRRRIHIFS